MLDATHGYIQSISLFLYRNVCPSVENSLDNIFYKITFAPLFRQRTIC